VVMVVRHVRGDGFHYSDALCGDDGFHHAKQNYQPTVDSTAVASYRSKSLNVMKPA
jgi:hypothetical protein